MLLFLHGTEIELKGINSDIYIKKVEQCHNTNMLIIVNTFRTHFRNMALQNEKYITSKPYNSPGCTYLFQRFFPFIFATL